MVVSSDYLYSSNVNDEDDQCSYKEEALMITLHVLKKMNQTDLANTLQTSK